MGVRAFPPAAILTAAILTATILLPAAPAAASVHNHPPTAPVLSSAAGYGPGARLVWVAATDDGAVVAYEILRDTYYSDEEVIATVDGGTTVYIDYTAPPFVNTYRVRAVDDAGNVSEPSNALTAFLHPTTRPFPQPPGFSCVAEYYYPSIRFPGQDGMTSANIIVTNFGDPIDGWRLTWTFPNDLVINGNIRGAVVTQDGNAVVATNLPSNAVVAHAGTFEVDFTGTWTTPPSPPADFALNSSPCLTG